MSLYCCCQRDIYDEHYASLHLTEDSSKSVGTVTSSSQNILRHKMQHAPFFHRPLVSLISLRLTPLQLHPSEQPFRSAEVGTHCWDVPHSRSPLCPAPGGKEETLPSPTQTSCRAFQTLSHHREKRHSSRGTKLREGCRNQGCHQGAAFKQRDLAGTRRERQGSGSEASNSPWMWLSAKTTAACFPAGGRSPSKALTQQMPLLQS